eukprot:1158101-Pelagomonas_calceolata.AAC.5
MEQRCMLHSRGAMWRLIRCRNACRTHQCKELGACMRGGTQLLQGAFVLQPHQQAAQRHLRNVLLACAAGGSSTSSSTGGPLWSTTACARSRRGCIELRPRSGWIPRICCCLATSTEPGHQAVHQLPACVRGQPLPQLLPAQDSLSCTQGLQLRALCGVAVQSRGEGVGTGRSKGMRSRLDLVWPGLRLHLHVLLLQLYMLLVRVWRLWLRVRLGTGNAWKWTAGDGELLGSRTETLLGSEERCFRRHWLQQVFLCWWWWCWWWCCCSSRLARPWCVHGRQRRVQPQQAAADAAQHHVLKQACFQQHTLHGTAQRQVGSYRQVGALQGEPRARVRGRQRCVLSMVAHSRKGQRGVGSKAAQGSLVIAL